jgi:N-acetylmuramoyl-L-alanine amidase
MTCARRLLATALCGLVLLAAGAGAAAAAPAPAAPRVVLDPGHGGSNTGAAGVIEGLYEKRLTLALARAVEQRLRAAGVDVVLTRRDDRYVSLRERVRIANAADAALFVSLHANASPTRAQRGTETYILTPEALAVDSVALRGADGPPRPGLDRDTALLLDDLERGSALPAAVRLAERVQARLAEARPESRGVRQGSMDVLMGPTIPAVLVEVGFIDHPLEGIELLRREVRERIASAIAGAILETLALQ